MYSGSAVECVDLETGVVGECRETRSFRDGDGLERGVALERGFSLVDVRPIEPSDDLPRMIHPGEDRFHLTDLVRVLRRYDDPMPNRVHALQPRCSSTSSRIPLAARSSI